MKFVAVLLMLLVLGNHELNRGLGMPQVVHGSGRPCFVFLPPPPPPPPPIAAAVSPPLKELRHADDVVAPVLAPPAEPPAEPPRKRGRLHGKSHPPPAPCQGAGGKACARCEILLCVKFLER